MRVGLSLNKVQLVSAVEPLLRRLMGYGTVSVETARLHRRRERPARRRRGPHPHGRAGPPGRALHRGRPRPHPGPLAPTSTQPTRALRRAVMASVLFAAPIGLMFGIAAGGGAASPRGRGRHPRHVGPHPCARCAQPPRHGLARHAGRRAAPRRRHPALDGALARKKLQSTHLIQGPLDRLHGLAHLTINVAGSSVRLPPLALANDARRFRRSCCGRAEVGWAWRVSHTDEGPRNLVGSVGWGSREEGVARARAPMVQHLNLLWGEEKTRAALLSFPGR
ncbi:MAG: hypothetical protein IPN01_16335 [Deltaproteobacteria bacterium]|nr:hypothetical protein [Deltaproteobacteria bacterium]